jgi:hypothetical protein
MIERDTVRVKPARRRSARGRGGVPEVGADPERLLQDLAHRSVSRSSVRKSGTDSRRAAHGTECFAEGVANSRDTEVLPLE